MDVPAQPPDRGPPFFTYSLVGVARFVCSESRAASGSVTKKKSRRPQGDSTGSLQAVRRSDLFISVTQHIHKSIQRRLSTSQINRENCGSRWQQRYKRAHRRHLALDARSLRLNTTSDILLPATQCRRSHSKHASQCKKIRDSGFSNAAPSRAHLAAPAGQLHSVFCGQHATLARRPLPGPPARSTLSPLLSSPAPPLTRPRSAARARS